jgi:hypothetical protein
MRSHARNSILALLTGVLLLLAAPVGAQAAPGIASFFAANCKVNTCEKQATPEKELEHAKTEGFTQAAGRPNFGITDFTVTSKESKTKPGELEPEGVLTHVRTDVAPGVATNPDAVPKCSFEEFGIEVAEGAFTPPTCKAATEIGINKVLLAVYNKKGEFVTDLPLEGKAYNLEPPKGLASDYGVAIELPEFITGVKGLYAHTLIEGSVEWGAEAEGTGKADYHDYFEIKVSPLLPVIKSRLIFKGNIGTGFITNATICNGVGPNTTTQITLKFEGVSKPSVGTYSTPIGLENCGAVPFEPGFNLVQSTTASDTPDGLTTELSLPHDPNPEHLDDSQVKTAKVVLPPGITINPAAASGLEACTPAQIGIGTKNPIGCPAGSKMGTVALNVPGLPEGSLTGNFYLGEDEIPITKPPYTVYVTAESERYGIVVRLKGRVSPNPTTGQLTTTFTENPEQPFTNLTIKLKEGPLAPLANNLACEKSNGVTEFTPFTGTAAKEPTAAFEVSGCPASLPFSLTQGTATENPQAGAHTAYALALGRSDGNQFLNTVTTTLPSGLVGAIPVLTLCQEPQAAQGTCPQASRIGTAHITAGAGSFPFAFSGPVYMTGPYGGAPFGLSVPVPAVAGPFNLGTIVTRATVNVNQTTAQVTVSASLPTIVGGIPVRLRSMNVEVNKQSFLSNPTNCQPEATNTTLGSTFGAVQSLSSPFQVEGCGGLAFKPSFKAASGANTSKVNGASLETTLDMPAGGANVKSVLVQLPMQLPSRLTTLQKACPEATFAANPFSCPEASMVGGVRANTPTLPTKLTGPAILVSHGGAEFPDLDLILQGDGVTVILKGSTNIKKGITTSNFAATPDVPVSSITVNLPIGPHSALAAFGDVCASPLYMPTTITGQNGVVVNQKTKINVKNCPVKVVGKKVIGDTAYLSVKTFGAGKIKGSGKDLIEQHRAFNNAQSSASLDVPLSSSGRGRRKPFTLKVKVDFQSKSKGLSNSSTQVSVRFP